MGQAEVRRKPLDPHLVAAVDSVRHSKCPALGCRAHSPRTDRGGAGADLPGVSMGEPALEVSRLSHRYRDTNESELLSVMRGVVTSVAETRRPTRDAAVGVRVTSLGPQAIGTVDMTSGVKSLLDRCSPTSG